MERFWRWFRKKTHIDQLDAQTQHMLIEMIALRAAIGDLRENLDMPPMVNMDDINEKRAPAGDPTGF